jgi:transposase
MNAAIRANAPALLDIYCCGTISAAQLALAAGDNPGRLENEAAFASLCGASPIECSSGKVVRHRLNRGGNRQANRALHTIARQRMKRDARTRRYVAKRTEQGKSRKEIERCIVRYIAREAFHAITHPLDTDWLGFAEFGKSLKKRRLAAGGTQQQAASALGVASARISEAERGERFEEGLLLRYRDWIDSLEKASCGGME